MNNIKYYLSVASFISAIILGTIALFLPPQGVIDASVLWFTAQLLVFTSTMLGFNMTIDNMKQKITGGTHTE